MSEMTIEFIANRDKTKTQVIRLSNAKICFRNFRGEASVYNDAGNRGFSVVIPDEEIAEALRNDVNEFDAGWNVKIRAAREEGDTPFMHLPVKVKYTDRSAPKVYLESGNKRVKLDENTIKMLDNIDIAYCDLDIRPYDGEGRFGPHRTAYLQEIWVVQDLSRDRFSSRFANEEEE